MWHYFPRGPLEKRVFKTRFIIQKNFENLQVPSTASRIGSEQRDSDQREGDPIRENFQVPSTWVARPRPRDLGRANPGRAPGVAWPRQNPGARPGFAQPRCATHAISFSPSLIWLFLSLLSGLPLSDLTLSLIWSIRWGEAVLGTWRFLKFFWIINRVFKTRFSSGPREK